MENIVWYSVYAAASSAHLKRNIFSLNADNSINSSVLGFVCVQLVIKMRQNTSSFSQIYRRESNVEL